MASEVPGFESLPGSLQTVITVAVGISAAIAAGWTYLARLKKGDPDLPPKADLVVTSATIADMAPLRELPTRIGDLQNEMRGVRHACEGILAHLTEIERDREEDRRVERRVKEELLQHAKRAARPSSA